MSKKPSSTKGAAGVSNPPAEVVQPSVQVLSVADLKADPDNPRTIEKKARDGLKASMEQLGLLEFPVVNVRNNEIISGHQRVDVLREKGVTNVSCIVVDFDAEMQKFANVTMNNTEIQGEFTSRLKGIMESLKDGDADRFSSLKLNLLRKKHSKLFKERIDKLGKTDPDALPEPQAKVKTKLGDLYELGDHRLLCGDSIKSADLAKLFGEERAVLVHADPPYGMGKDGVTNDDLTGKRLDAFQIAWWSAIRPHLVDNASVYIWGNAFDLWRLWFGSKVDTGLSSLERMTWRNEIAWDKSGIEKNPTLLVNGVPLEANRSYMSTERCLFFMLGEQSMSINSEDYWEGWEPVRSYLAGEVDCLGWGPKEVKKITGVGMFAHWFTTSQFTLISRKHYLTLRQASDNKAFLRPYDDDDDEATDTGDLVSEYVNLHEEFSTLREAFYETRAYFDNTHDAMTDVWKFGRVTGDDRHGHATPKPVDLVGRAIKSSSLPGKIVYAPFGGSGSDVIAAEKFGRRCYAMEIEPVWCDTIIARWEAFTGKKARKVRA